VKATEGNWRGSTSSIERAVTKSTSHLCDSPLDDGQEAAEVCVGKEVPTANAALAISEIPWWSTRHEANCFGHNMILFFARWSHWGSARPSAIDQVAALGIVRHLSYSCGKSLGSSRQARLSFPIACALWAPTRSGICLKASHFRPPKIPERNWLAPVSPTSRAILDEF
jgi:hypothetical protein